MKTICLFLAFGTCALMAQSPASPEKLYDDDLRFMTSVVPKFHLSASDPEGTLEQLCGETAESLLGKGHKIPFLIADKNISTASLKLDLHDIPVPVLLNYIAELSSRKWKYWHGPGPPVLTFYPITQIDDTDSFHRVQTFELTPDGAKHLGLRDSMSEAEVRKFLQDYGVEFPKEANAFWNAKTHTLAVRNLAEENEVVRGIARLANKGFEFVRSPAKEEASKK